MSEAEELLELLKKSPRTTAFTGAGVSTLSGIRDFRGKNGVYLEPWRGYDVEEILSLPLFLKEPGIFYAWAKEFIYRLEEFHPSAVHNALALMEQKGLLWRLYTQNIDLLHQKAGSRKVFELHGSPAHHHCLRCHREYPYEVIASEVLADKVPHCSCGGVIKPDIVFYGENLDETLLMQAEEEMQQTTLLLVLGSSLTVYPAAGLPEICGRSGGKVIIVNDQPTPFDAIAFRRYSDLKTLFAPLETLLHAVNPQ